ncbi:MAG TPA: DUF2795 domain-containing protein [Candidatus Limnocylindrales bacterium]|nr:DUF2795 domain-containing protein [Candidatus Limnocylindrales bacterium]
MAEKTRKDQTQEDKQKTQKDSQAPNPIQVQKYLSGIDYPTDKQGLLEAARRNGADEKVLNILNELPEKSYASPKEVSHEIGQVE